MRRSLPLLFLLASAGCYPTLPAHVAESPEVLSPGKIGFTVLGGGGMFDTNCCKTAPPGGVASPSTIQGMAGLETRVRVGLPAKQEVGASFFGGIGSMVGGGDPPFVIGGKGTYKIAPVHWLAFIANGGAQVVGVSGVAMFGGDLAAIAAPWTASNGTQLYTGVKGGLAIPVLQDARATSEAFTFPVGIDIHTSERVRLLFETGFILGMTQVYQGGGTQSATSPGGYGLVAYSYHFR